MDVHSSRQGPSLIRSGFWSRASPGPCVSQTGENLGVFASGSTPSWLTTDPKGNVYVSAYTGNAVQVFSPSGVPTLSIPTTFMPGGVAVGGDGSIFVADYFGGSVYRYSSTGTSLGLFSDPGLARADFIEFNAAGDLFISDFMDGVVRRISPTGIDLGNFVSGLAGSDYGGPEGLGFDADGNLYVAIYRAGTVKSTPRQVKTLVSLQQSAPMPTGSRSMRREASSMSPI